MPPSPTVSITYCDSQSVSLFNQTTILYNISDDVHLLLIYISPHYEVGAEIVN